jgi:MinD-like ATPase involved in chromosome partitioning or flagellar assembly
MSYALLKVIKQQKLCDSPALLVNMVESNEQGAKVHEALTNVAEQYLSSKMQLLGMIPTSNVVRAALTKRVPVVTYKPEHDVSTTFMQIAKSLVQKRIANTQPRQS